MRSLLLLPLLVGLSAIPAHASTVTLDISGQVYGTDNLGLFGKAGAVLDGTSFSFNLAYDTDILSKDNGYYSYLNSPAGNPLISNALEIGSVKRTIYNNEFSFGVYYDSLYSGQNIINASVSTSGGSYGEAVTIYGNPPGLPSTVKNYQASTQPPGEFFNALYIFANTRGFEQIALGVQDIKITNDISPVPLTQSYSLMGMSLLILDAFSYLRRLR